MKSIGMIIKILALVLALTMLGTSIGSIMLDSEYYTERWEQMEESIEEHEKEIAESEEHNADECYQCENLEDSKKSLERSENGFILNSIQTIALLLLYSAILFALGEILSKQGRAKKEAVAAVAAAPAAPAAQQATTTFCPKCGATLPAGTRFCGTCGTTLGQ